MLSVGRCAMAEYYHSDDEPASCNECGGLLADGHMPGCSWADDSDAFTMDSEGFGSGRDEHGWSATQGDSREHPARSVDRDRAGRAGVLSVLSKRFGGDGDGGRGGNGGDE